MPTALPSPSSSVSAADTALPTPDHPASARRSIVPSPTLVHSSDMSPGELERRPLDDDLRDDPADDLFSPAAPKSTKVAHDASSGVAYPTPYPATGDSGDSGDSGDLTPQPTASVPSISIGPLTPAADQDQAPDAADSGVTSSTPASRHSTSASGARASPRPPPIFLRQPSDVGAAAKGLNIAGVGLSAVEGTAIEREEPEQSHDDDDDDDEGEDDDALPEMMASPRRLVFEGAAPPSPAWQSFDQPSGSGSPGFGARQSPRFASSSGAASLAVPQPQPSPLGPRSSGAGRDRFDPTPNHGIHSRNLSLFFPQPGAAPAHTSSLSASGPSAGGTNIPPPRGGSPGLLDSPDNVGVTTMMPSASDRDRKVFGGTGNWSFGQGQGASTDAQGLLTPEVKRSKRRGHHHKHSLSHNFFSFLDPTQTNPNLAAPAPNGAAATTPSRSPNPSATPAPVPMPLLPPSTTSQTLSPLPSSKSDPHNQFLMSVAVLELLIGAGLWIEGQMSGWRCLAGVGYLVVFDAVGVAVGIVGRGEGQGWSSVRRPYGPSRLVSLLYFAQSLFLVFAAVYIAKESLEQVILGSGAHEHAVGAHGHGDGGGGGHGHAHGHAGDDGEERDFPHFLLLCAASASIFSGGALGNHSKLVDAVGPLFLPSTYLSLPFVSAWPKLLANPYSLTVTGASLGILMSTLIVPSTALHSLDSLISLLLTLLVSTLAYPPTIFFAHILLQTAPPGAGAQMLALKRALKEVREDRRVLGLGTVRCWAVSVGKGGWDDLSHGGGYTPGGSRQGSVSSPLVTPRQSMEFPSFSAFASANPSVPPSPTSGSWAGRKDEASASAPLVITLAVHVHPDLGDREVLEVTRMVWGKVSAAAAGVGGGPGGVGAGGVGGQGEGEVSVQVKRGWDGMEE